MNMHLGEKQRDTPVTIRQNRAEACDQMLLRTASEPDFREISDSGTTWRLLADQVRLTKCTECVSVIGLGLDSDVLHPRAIC